MPPAPWRSQQEYSVCVPLPTGKGNQKIFARDPHETGTKTPATG